MPRLLVINPNTSQTTTERLASLIPQTVDANVQVDFVTARFGAPYIACEASYAVAGHATLDAWAHFLERTPETDHPDRVLIACFGDPGLHAMRDSVNCPVTGLVEASLIEAGAMGPFAIVTGGARWESMLHRIVQSLKFGSGLKHIEVVRETGAKLLADPVRAIEVLTTACQRAAGRDVKSVILGGAGLAGYAAIVQPLVDVPVIDSVLAGARVVMGDNLPVARRLAPHYDVRWQQLPAAMQRLGN